MSEDSHLLGDTGPFENQMIAMDSYPRKMYLFT